VAVVVDSATSSRLERQDVTVIVVTWNSSELLGGFVEALRSGMAGVASWQLVIVDNDSADGTIEVAERLAPAAITVRNTRNAGYAAGINKGVEVAGPTAAYLVVNPDIRLGECAVIKLLAELERPATGIVVPQLRRPDGRLVRSLRREPTLYRLLTEAFLGGPRADRWLHGGELVRDERAYARPTTADWATGAAMLISAPCLERTGPWDESFFLYGEETEFALRARDLGYQLRYLPAASAVHIGGQAHLSPDLYSLLTVNRARAFRKRHGRLASLLFWMVLVVSEGLRSPGKQAAIHRAALVTLLRPTRQRRLTAGGWTQDGPPRPRHIRGTITKAEA
jgi:N-acetylglucosaminyl-diphospho-decaprenol L-rhamnosyltransferase